LEQFPNTTTGKATVLLETYNASGALLGTSEPIAIDILCPEDVIPSAGFLAIDGTNMFGPLYIQGISSASATVSGWAGVYGSTIKTVVLAGNGRTATLDMNTGTAAYSDSLKLDAGLLKASGTIPFTVSVTDSRGRTSTITQEINVAAYSPISIQSTAQGRVARAGSNTYDSGYAKIEYDYTVLTYQEGAITHYNTPTLTIYWEANSVVVDGYASKAQQYFAEDDANGLRKDAMYTVRFYLTDGISSTVVTRTIGTAYAFMRWDPANNAVGFGCYPQSAKCVEIGPDWT
jgi:hypothetical protein